MATEESIASSLVPGRRAFPYPSPFFDIANTRNPPSYKALFDYCQTYATSHPLVSTVIQRLAHYPITKILIEHETSDVQDQWERILRDHLKLRSKLQEFNLDYFAIGNAFVTVMFPFMRYLRCSNESCKAEFEMRAVKEYKLHQRSLLGKCETCDQSVTWEVFDKDIKDPKQIRLVALPAKQIDIDYNEITGHKKYTYMISAKMKKQIQSGDREILQTVPWIFIEAALTNKGVTLDPTRVYHYCRPSISSLNTPWGMPLVMPVLKNLYLMQVFLKAREQIAHEHVVPLRVIFPMPNQASDPVADLNLSTWVGKLENELKKWRQDPNYIPIMPIGIGTAFLGGDANALSVAREVSEMNRDIIAGMMVPMEFVYGGLTFSGSSVSLRMLENDFLNLRESTLELVNGFIVPLIAKYLDYPLPKVKFSDLRTADDVQKQAQTLSLVQAGYASVRRLLEDSGFDPEEEFEEMKKEAETMGEILAEKGKGQAKAQGEMMLMGQEYQLKAQIRAMVRQQGVQTDLAQAMGPNASQEEIMAAQNQLTAQGAFQPPNQGMVHQYMLAGGSGKGSGGGGGGEGGGGDVRQIVGIWAAELAQKTTANREATLSRIRANHPAIASTLEETLAQMQGSLAEGGGGRSASKVDRRPSPEQKPERRKQRNV